MFFTLADYLNGIMEGIMYLLISPEIYGCNAVGVLAQDLVVQYVLIPVLNLISDPDFVNQYIVWLVSAKTNITKINAVL